VSVQVVSGSQPPLSVAHVLTQPVCGVPEYPGGQTQVDAPAEFTHTESEGQPPLLLMHSSMSMHPLVPSPV
jgi:hypothetical protein